MSKVFKHLLSGVSITSTGSCLVLFIFVHKPDITCPNIIFLELGISILSTKHMDAFQLHQMKNKLPYLLLF